MGYLTSITGQLDIDPPIKWGDIRNSPFLPSERGGDPDKEVMLVLEEHDTDTDEGALRVIEATGVVTRYESQGKYYDIQAHLQELVDAFPGYVFSSRFDCDGEDSGDLWRLKVVDGKATRFVPSVTWPIESE